MWDSHFQYIFITIGFFKAFSVILNSQKVAILMKGVVKWMISNAICPPRCKYNLSNIITVITDENNNAYERKRIEIISNDVKLECSLWTLSGYSSSKCLIYLHSAGMNQFEAINLVPYLVTSELSLFAFDFPGCGMSDGKFLPFDGSGPPHVKNCLEHLRSVEKIKKFCLWGRSMGAAIALQCVSYYTKDFFGVVADSPFCNLTELLKFVVKKNGCPKMFSNMAVKYLKKQTKKIYGVDIDYHFPMEDIKMAKAPLLIGHGKQDNFVPPRQSEKLFMKYGTLNKQLYIFDATHFKSRPYFWYEMAAKFIYRNSKINVKPRFYENVYGKSLLHIGEKEEILQYLRDAITNNLSFQVNESSNNS